MNNEEAKFILSGYRPNGADAGDATFCAAIEQSRRDPALGAWFEFEQKFDRIMTAKLGDIHPPAGLREAILAGTKVSSQAPRIWWRQPMWYAAAASVGILLAVGSLLLWPARADAREFARFAMLDSIHDDQHHGKGDENLKLQTSLQNPSHHLCDGVPVDFAHLSASGCRTLRFAGHEVLEVCFQRNGAWFHCYIVPKADFGNIGTGPEISRQGAVCCATWTDAQNIFVVVSSAGTDALKSLL